MRRHTGKIKTWFLFLPIQFLYSRLMWNRLLLIPSQFTMHISHVFILTRVYIASFRAPTSSPISNLKFEGVKHAWTWNGALVDWNCFTSWLMESVGNGVHSSEVFSLEKGLTRPCVENRTCILPLSRFRYYTDFDHILASNANVMKVSHELWYFILRINFIQR